MSFIRVAGTIICSALILCVLAISAFADSASEARERLSKEINAVFVVLNDERYKGEENQNAKIDAIETHIKNIFDYSEFSARTVGRPWSKFSPEEQEQFAMAFADLLRATYLERIGDFSTSGVNYDGERVSRDGSKVEVMTHLDYNGKNVPVSYRMVKRSDWVVYDVIVEGVSLVKNYRTQFKELLKDTDAQGLIKIVRERADKTRVSGDK